MITGDRSVISSIQIEIGQMLSQVWIQGSGAHVEGARSNDVKV